MFFLKKGRSILLKIVLTSLLLYDLLDLKQDFWVSKKKSILNFGLFRCGYSWFQPFPPKTFLIFDIFFRKFCTVDIFVDCGTHTPIIVSSTEKIEDINGAMLPRGSPFSEITELLQNISIAINMISLCII